DQSEYKQRMVDYAPTSAGWYGITPEQLAREIEETRIYPPDTTFSDATDLFDLVHFHGPNVELRYFGPGHTNGDTLVYLSDARVLFGGDLVCNHVFPNAMDGDPLHWPEVLDQIEQLDLRAIVPGHGPIG